MVALRFWIQRNRYAVDGHVLQDQLIGHIPDIMREVQGTGPLGIALMTAARAFLPFITTMDARKKGRIPPDYQALRKAKQDVTMACLNYWFESAWTDLASTTWNIETRDDDGTTWVSGLAPIAPAVVETGAGARPALTDGTGAVSPAVAGEFHSNH